jgi:protein-tyrosine-phosphatase
LDLSVLHNEDAVRDFIAREEADRIELVNHGVLDMHLVGEPCGSVGVEILVVEHEHLTQFDLSRPDIQITVMFGMQDDVIEEAPGRINPHDPDIIQQMQRTLRLQGRKFNTEKAYLKKVRQFMRERCLKCAADFATIGPADVESFLTDLAVDGDVSDDEVADPYGLSLRHYERTAQEIEGLLGTIIDHLYPVPVPQP